MRRPRPIAGTRPAPFRKPDYWSDAPAPTPAEALPIEAEDGELDPTRYGDWERNGIAVDF